MDIINLNVINGKKYKVLSGVDLGEKARKEFNIDLLDTQNNQVEFIIPDDVYSVNSSFFSGLFQKSIKTLGVNEFKARYIFSCDEIIRMNINNGIFNIVNTLDLLGGQSWNRKRKTLIGYL